MTKKKVASFYDKNGLRCIDCTECVHGANGDKDCSAGWRVKRKNKAGCFAGTPLPEIIPLTWEEHQKVVA